MKNTLSYWLLLKCTLIVFLLPLQAVALIEVVEIRAASNGCNGMVLIQAEGTAGPFQITLEGSANTYLASDINGKKRFRNICGGVSHNNEKSRVVFI